MICKYFPSFCRESIFTLLIVFFNAQVLNVHYFPFVACGFEEIQSHEPVPLFFF